MGVGIETSVGNPSNVGLKVPVHVAQGSCEVFTEPHLLHTYKPIHLPSGLVISQHLCTLHTHTHIQSQNLERGSSVLSSISCSTKWDLLHNKCHNCLLTAGTRSFKWFRLLHGIIYYNTSWDNQKQVAIYVYAISKPNCLLILYI